LCIATTDRVTMHTIANIETGYGVHPANRIHRYVLNYKRSLLHHRQIHHQ